MTPDQIPVRATSPPRDQIDKGGKVDDESSTDPATTILLAEIRKTFSAVLRQRHVEKRLREDLYQEVALAWVIRKERPELSIDIYQHVDEWLEKEYSHTYPKVQNFEDLYQEATYEATKAYGKIAESQPGLILVRREDMQSRRDEYLCDWIDRGAKAWGVRKRANKREEERRRVIAKARGYEVSAWMRYLKESGASQKARSLQSKQRYYRQYVRPHDKAYANAIRRLWEMDWDKHHAKDIEPFKDEELASRVLARQNVTRQPSPFHATVITMDRRCPYCDKPARRNRNRDNGLVLVESRRGSADVVVAAECVCGLRFFREQ